MKGLFIILALGIFFGLSWRKPIVEGTIVLDDEEEIYDLEEDDYPFARAN